MTSPTNGNGNGKPSIWGPMSICSGVVLAIGSAFGSAYVREQDRFAKQVEELESARVEDARVRGEMQERLNHLAEFSATNRRLIEDGLEAVDLRLQREMRDLDNGMEAKITGADGRLQTEIGNMADTLSDRINALRAWVDGNSAGLWTVEDQRRFEDQLGLTLKP